MGKQKLKLSGAVEAVAAFTEASANMLRKMEDLLRTSVADNIQYLTHSNMALARTNAHLALQRLIDHRARFGPRVAAPGEAEEVDRSMLRTLIHAADKNSVTGEEMDGKTVD